MKATISRAAYKPNTLKQVREKVDFIYELTSSEGGYTGSMSNSGTRFKHITTIMVKRGILIKSGTQLHPNYRWNENAMAPTDNLYKSIAKEMVKTEREWSMRNRTKNTGEKKESLEEVAQINRDKETGLWIIEYNEAQGLFHTDSILEREDGKRYTSHELNDRGWIPVGIVTDAMLNEAINWSAELISPKSLTADEVRKAFFFKYGVKYTYSRYQGLRLGSECESAPDIPEVVQLAEEPERVSLENFTIQQLWDELKRRGCYIDGGKLAQKTIQYFE